MTAAPPKPRIAIGSDHAGFSLKEIIRKHFQSTGYVVCDLGTSSEESVDYPDYGKAVAERVISRSEEHTSELQSQSNLVCRLLLEKKKNTALCPSYSNQQ